MNDDGKRAAEKGWEAKEQNSGNGECEPEYVSSDFTPDSRRVARPMDGG